MTVFLVEPYMIRPDKQAEFNLHRQRFLKYKEKHPERSKELKSLRSYVQFFGGTYGGRIDMWEFDGLTDYEKFWAKWRKDKELVKFEEEFFQLIDPTTYSINVWNAVT